METALDGLRILDLTGPEGHLCGRLLADLGAEVIKVEPPAGDPARHRGPYKGDRPDPEASLPFVAFNTNKKSVALDLTTESGRERFRRLASTADAIVETDSPGALEASGLDPRALQQDNPRLVLASISGFGRSGPYAHFKAPSIVCAAMGGVMYLCGVPDRPPLAPPGDQPYYLASAFAAVGVLLALRERDRSGSGQQVEVACQEVEAAQQYVVVNYSSNATILQRAGSRSAIGGGMPYGVYPAADGHCHLVVISPAHWRRFVDWIGNPELLADPIWENRHVRNASADLIEPLTAEFTQQFPKAELFVQGQARHLTIAPINRPDEFIRDPHARDRDLFVPVEHPTLGTYELLQSPFKLSQTPGRIFRPAPRLGQHDDEVLHGPSPQCPPPPGRGEAFRRRDECTRPAVGMLRPYRSHVDASPLSGSGALAGVRVLDFSQAVAGPFLTRVLAEHGAEVIKVESTAHQQRGRDRPGLDPRIVLQRTVTFADINRQKRSIAVNMSSEEGRQVVRRLVPACDVVVENFSPRVMEQWGLGYEELRALRPDVIMARLSGFGITGPYRDYVCLAAVALSITGLYHLWSYADGEEPAGPPIWFPDYFSAALAGIAILAALRHRDRTGQGQLIDLGQVDATALALGTSYLEYALNGVVARPQGNRHREVAPQGVYRCRGDDAWCAIAVRDEAEWRAFCEVLGSPRWCQDERFATMPRRLAHHDELDRQIEAWTIQHTPHQVMRWLQEAGVPAGAVLDGERLFQDPHLRRRGFIVEVDDPETGPIEYPGPFVHLSRTPAQSGRPHRFGEDHAYVFGTLLGMSRAEIQRLEQAGVLA